ncbi:MAG: hypothetical protein ACI9UK_000547 [Candidatus Krumholzibacteriia bacterium]|jgi:hypothetical protein
MKFSLTSALVMTFVLFLTVLISPHTGFVFLWWGLVAASCHWLIWRKANVGRVLLVYACYSLLAIIIYKTQLWTNPAFYGFSGDGLLNSVGTDDSFFYSLVAYDLPHDFPRRFAIGVQSHRYADLLSILVAAHRRVFPSLHPLDLIFFNTSVLAFFPFFVRQIYCALFVADRGDRWAFVMSAVAPFLLANGVILMRDGLVATVFAGGIMAVQQRRWWWLGLFAVATAWLRPQNGVMLLTIVVALGLSDRYLDEWRQRWRRRDALMRLTIQCFGVLLASLVIVQGVFHVAWWEMLFRGDFLRNYVGQGAAQDSGTSTFYTLSQLPLLARLPMTLIFYLGSPFFSIGAFRDQGLWVPRVFLTSIFPLLFPIYAAWFYRGVLRVVRSRHIGALIFLLLFLLNLSLITQASMQLRHKIPLQSMFYVMVAAGITTPYNQDRSIGWLVAIAVVLLNLVFNLLQLAGG